MYGIPAVVNPGPATRIVRTGQTLYVDGWGKRVTIPASERSAGEPLRAWRSLAVLERAGTAEAKRLLQELAGGDPDVWLTRGAKDALGRLAK